MAISRRQFIQLLAASGLLSACKGGGGSGATATVGGGLTAGGPGGPDALTRSYLHLAMDEGAGNVLIDKGTLVPLAINSGIIGDPWNLPGWFSSQLVGASHAWSDDPDVLSLLDILHGADQGTGGGVLFGSCFIKANNFTGTLLAAGTQSDSGYGWDIHHAGGNMFFRLYWPNGAWVQRKLFGTGSIPQSGDHHLAFLLDFANGEYASWVDGERTLIPEADRSSLLALASDPGQLLTSGLTVMSGNISTVPQHRFVANPWTGSMRELILLNMGWLENPWSNIDRFVHDLYSLSNPDVAGCIRSGVIA